MLRGHQFKDTFMSSPWARDVCSKMTSGTQRSTTIWNGGGTRTWRIGTSCELGKIQKEGRRKTSTHLVVGLLKYNKGHAMMFLSCKVEVLLWQRFYYHCSESPVTASFFLGWLICARLKNIKCSTSSSLINPTEFKNQPSPKFLEKKFVTLDVYLGLSPFPVLVEKEDLYVRLPYSKCNCPGGGYYWKGVPPNIYCSPPIVFRGTIVCHRLGIFFPCQRIDDTCTIHWNATASTEHVWWILEPTILTGVVGICLKKPNTEMFVFTDSWSENGGLLRSSLGLIVGPDAGRLILLKKYHLKKYPQSQPDIF